MYTSSKNPIKISKKIADSCIIGFSSILETEISKARPKQKQQLQVADSDLDEETKQVPKRQETNLGELEDKVRSLKEKQREAIFNKILRFVEERIDKAKDASQKVYSEHRVNKDVLQLIIEVNKNQVVPPGAYFYSAADSLLTLIEFQQEFNLDKKSLQTQTSGKGKLTFSALISVIKSRILQDMFKKLV